MNFVNANHFSYTPFTTQVTRMPAFHPFPKLPKEIRLQIYEDTFEERILQLGVDAGVPFPPELEPWGDTRVGMKQSYTRLPSLFHVCRESRHYLKSIYVAFGPIFIHPKLDTLYISLYAVGRMMTTELSGARNADGSSAYNVAAFDKVAIEYSVKDLPEDLEAWMEWPDIWQIRRGVKQLCPPGKWPATDYAEFFRCFGAPREVLLVTDGVMRWTGGFSKFTSWLSIKLKAAEIESGDQKNLVEFLKSQMPSSLAESMTQFTVVDALKEDTRFLAFPYVWTQWRDMTERYLYI